MSDPLQSTRQAISEISLSQHKFQPMSVSAVLRVGPQDKLSDRLKAAAAIEKGRLDVELCRGVAAPRAWVGDPEMLKRLDGKQADKALMASSTQGLQVKPPLPFLLLTAQEVCDKLPEGSMFPGTKAACIKAASTRAYVGGGTHLSLMRVIEHSPKKGESPSRPPSLAEALTALKATGRVLRPPYEAPYSLAYDARSIELNATADNGFPVGSDMRNPDARELALKLAGEIRTRMDRQPDKLVAARILRDNAPELSLFKGKTKTDIYGIGKVSAGQLRFYNTGGRQVVMIMQQATQPLAETWKAESANNYRTMVGKGLARGGADKLICALEWGLERDGYAWTHCGDDTLIVRKLVRNGQTVYVIFSLDCTAFDLTQHSSVTESIHLLMYQQMRNIDETSAALWYTFMRERLVTVSGSVVVRTKHWGASGMPLQSEVNDTLMEVLVSRIGMEWTNKSELEQAVSERAREMGLKVRLEDYFEIPSRVERHQALHWLLSKRPFLYLGYHLWAPAPDMAVRPQIDVARFLSGFAYLQGAFEEKAVAGTRAAIVLAGYALAFGVPHPDYVPAFEHMIDVAVQALTAKSREINISEVQAELSKYAHAALGVSVNEVDGLIGALRRSESIWMEELKVEPSSLATTSAWADEPEEEGPFSALLGRPYQDAGLNEANRVTAKLAGTLPPTPARVLAERALAKEVRTTNREDEVEKSHRLRRPKNQRDKRAGDAGLWDLD